jgi:trans-aconitate methyltransferase
MADELKQQVMAQAQGAAALQVAFIGVASGLLEKLGELGDVDHVALAKSAGLDAGYVERWCDAAFAFGLLDERGGAFRLTELGRRFRPGDPATLMPFAVQASLGAHMADRVTSLIHTGERPGEQVLAERASILPWFGPMLEASFASLFETQIAPALHVFAEADAAGGLVVDLGCGNGWYLRRLLARYPRVRGIGLDGFEENIAQARRLAEADGLAARLEFRAGDIHHFSVDEPARVIAMNRALHHVWEKRESALAVLDRHLAPGGSVVFWEPRWPDTRAELREPRRRGMAFQNLSEHVQGNHFLRPDDVAAELERLGMRVEQHFFADGAEMVLVGTRPG